MKKQKNKVIITIILLVLIGVINTGSVNSQQNSPPNINKRDYVPDSATAVKIAEAVWLPIYGERIFEQKPYEVTLQDSIWIVRGTIPYGERLEGTAYIEIQKSDCKILEVNHGR